MADGKPQDDPVFKGVVDYFLDHEKPKGGSEQAVEKRAAKKPKITDSSVNAASSKGKQK